MNGIGLNLAMFITLLVTSVLGLINVSKAFHSAIGKSFAFSGLNRSLIIALALVFTALALWTIQKERRVNI